MADGQVASGQSTHYGPPPCGLLALLLRFLTSPFRSHFGLEVEVLVLRQQLAIYQRSLPRPRLRACDRLFWCWLSRLWSGWRKAIYAVNPATVITWRRRRFRDYWARLSAKRGPGRPPVAKEIQDLIRQMSKANVTWDSPRIKSEKNPRTRNKYGRHKK